MKIKLLKIPSMLTYRLKVEYDSVTYDVTIWIDQEKPHKFADWDVTVAGEEFKPCGTLVQKEIEDAIIQEVDKQWNKLTMA